VDECTADNSFSKARRLLTASDYSNDRSTHRLGLVIAKKNVRLAVERNRIKRVAREFFRQLPESEPGMDVVLLARRGIGQLDNAALSSILQQQWQRLLRQACKNISGTGQDT
jgi:ribonuclease P protein component